MTHLSDQLLIDYRFELLDEAERATAQAHLDACEACRNRHEAMGRRFGALDTLAGDPAITEGLLYRAIMAAEPAETQRVRWLPWVAALTCLAVITALLLLHPFIAITPRDSAPAIEPPFAPASNIELNVLPRRDHVQVTIYNSADLTLVRDRRELTMKHGWNWLQYMWANTLIDPTSLELSPVQADSGVSVEQLVFPPRLKDVGRWLLFSETTGQVPFDVTYFTSGLSWRAFYQATLSPDESTMRLQGFVRVANRSGEDYENAQVRLVVGEVNLQEQIAQLARRQPPYGRGGKVRLGDRQVGYDGLDDKDVAVYELTNVSAAVITWDYRAKQIMKQGLSEYFLYTIEGRDTIPDGWDKRLPSFTTEDIPVSNLYKYDAERWGETTRRFLYFANDEDHELGETPLPEGAVKVYREVDAAAHPPLSYEAAAPFKYIPVGEKAELDLGPASRVRVEPVLMEQRLDNPSFDRHGNLAGWDDVQAWELRLGNRRAIPVTLEVTRSTGSTTWTLEADDGNAVRHDASHLRWTLDLQPRTETTITYTTRIYQGTHKEKAP